jgi:hypothetical protein
MAFPNLFKLEKLKILSYTDSTRQNNHPETFEAMFNPESFSESYKTCYIATGGVNNPLQGATFGRMMPTSLRLKLLLDGTDVDRMGLTATFSKKQSVHDRIRKFRDLAYNINGDTHEPNYLKVVWGVLDFPCRLAGMTVTYTSFDRGGQPLRAELDLELIADEDAAKQLSAAALSSPDVTHKRQVASGDTLPLLTKEIYGTSSHYLNVARANGLDHFRRLKPGRVITFPPLAK